MECFNIFGLIFAAVIMIPNILFDTEDSLFSEHRPISPCLFFRKGDLQVRIGCAPRHVEPRTAPFCPSKIRRKGAAIPRVRAA